MVLSVIIILGFLSRLFLHTPNFSPVLSLALFSGLYLKGRQSVLMPVALMMLSDVVLGFHDTMFYTWGSIVVISGMGVLLKDHKRWANVLAASFFSAVLFFVVTNFGAFLSLYPHTWEGLRACYILAIPFYRSTLVSTMAYSVVLFAGVEFLARASSHSLSVKESAV